MNQQVLTNPNVLNNMHASSVVAKREIERLKRLVDVYQRRYDLLSRELELMSFPAKEGQSGVRQYSETYTYRCRVKAKLEAVRKYISMNLLFR